MKGYSPARTFLATVCTQSYSPMTPPLATIYAPSYSATAAKPPLQVQPPSTQAHVTAIAAAPAFPHYYTTMRPGRQRFPGDGPVCYYCGIRGHISRFCRRREQDERRGYAPFERDYSRFPYGYRRTEHVSPPRHPSSPPGPLEPSSHRSARWRSPSPYRRSLSPLRPATYATNTHQEN